jgi:hypothetical protein
MVHCLRQYASHVLYCDLVRWSIHYVCPKRDTRLPTVRPALSNLHLTTILLHYTDYYLRVCSVYTADPSIQKGTLVT